MSKNIALFIDGTWNEPDEEKATNVYKLYLAAEKVCKEEFEWSYIDGPFKALKSVLLGLKPLKLKKAKNGATQVVHYMKGVGTGGCIDETLGGVLGFGTEERIKEAYLFLALNYKAGDNVYLFGFSRGAFAARALANFVGMVGLLFENRATWKNVAEAYMIYEGHVSAEDLGIGSFFQELRSKTLTDAVELPSPIPIHFIGVWDTVKRLGVEEIQPTHWTKHHDNPKLPEHITHARHALALHDLRPEMEPVLWEDWDENPPQSRRENMPQSLEQVWFQGAHSDVGGGYNKNESELSDITLRWMACESFPYGLLLDFKNLPSVPVTPSKKIHFEKMFYALTPREILSSWKTRSTKLISSFYMHKTACEGLLDQAPREFRFEDIERRHKYNNEDSNRYDSLLTTVDQLTLALHLELSFTYNKKPCQ